MLKKFSALAIMVGLQNSCRVLVYSNLARHYHVMSAETG